MTRAGKIVNLSWMEHGLTFLNRIEQVEPNFDGGAVEFAKVICYYVLPESKGGSASRDLTEFKDPTPWKIHFQENAKALLN